MITIELSDGKQIHHIPGIDGFAIAEGISKSLAKKSLAIEVNGKIQDLSEKIDSDAKIRIITLDDDEALEIIRHDTAHVLAQAIKELYPDAQITIGPNIKDGFYYDISSEHHISTEDLEKIESTMRQIIKRGEKFIRRVVTKAEAIQYFSSIGEHYKVEIIEDLPDDKPISIYYQGEFCDLCRGPHGPSTSYLKAFKLTKVAGAYWRGDSNNPMLQRVYGTAWRNSDELQNYLNMLKEAERRDHRNLGVQMGLFHFQESAPGVVFWHPDGWTIFQTLVAYMRKRQRLAGYLEIATPEIMEQSLWVQSGHWEKFHDNMFTAHIHDEKHKNYVIKPMNCPGGIQVFNHLEGVCSYRELPIRLAEFGKVYRYEPSGALHGLMRARGFTQDDAHSFCSEEQIQDEVTKMCKLLFSVYADCGFNDVAVKISDRPEKRIGNDEVWDKAEAALANALESIGVAYSWNRGEGAFYGPKIEFQLRDALGRDWQMGTIQVDFNMAARLEAYYIGKDGQKYHPVMIHRAIFGSLERFIAIMLEHYAGWLPLWLSPVQVALITVNNHDDVIAYAEQIQSTLLEHDIRSKIDYSSETIGYKVRKHTLSKVPLIVTVGEKELAEGTIAIREHSLGQSGESSDGLAQGLVQNLSLSVAEFIAKYFSGSKRF